MVSAEGSDCRDPEMENSWCVQMPEARPVWQECTPEVSEARAQVRGSSRRALCSMAGGCISCQWPWEPNEGCKQRGDVMGLKT